MSNLNEMLLRDLEEFEDEVNQMDLETADLAKIEDTKIEEGREEDMRVSFQEYESKDFVAHEKDKLLESELYKTTMQNIEEENSSQTKPSGSTFELVVKCNQLITRIDQM